jgi:hypothetical protein
VQEWVLRDPGCKLNYIGDRNLEIELGNEGLDIDFSKFGILMVHDVTKHK